MEKMLLSVFMCFGWVCIILILTLIIALTWDYLTRKFVDACRHSKYAYDIIMWLFIRNRGRKIWRKMRKQFIDFKDVPDFEEFKKERKEFLEWQGYKEIVDGSLPPASTGAPMPKVKPPKVKPDKEALRKEIEIFVEKKYKDRITVLEDGIKKHKKDCPDDDFEPDHELWSLVEGE